MLSAAYLELEIRFYVRRPYSLEKTHLAEVVVNTMTTTVVEYNSGL